MDAVYYLSWLHRQALPLLAGLILFSVSPAWAQSVDGSAVIPLTRVDAGGQRITLDGALDEPLWQDLPVIDDMRVIDPDTMEQAPLSTEVRLFHDERGLYVGVHARQDPDTLVARLTPRDTRRTRDGIVLGLDTSGDGRYGFYLRVNLGGSLTDGTLLPEREIGMDWDGPWQAATQELDDGWSAEMFIPWSMTALPRLSEDTRRIGIYLEREVSHRNETWSWPALPNTNPEFISAFQPFEVEGIDPGGQFTLYPYASTTTDNINNDTDTRVGTDLYWRPNANTQLSATLNPDFGTVESDDIVVNLGAFETFFSEKRNFFLEGQEVFEATPRASGGGPFGPTTMLNTRRIGQAANFDVPEGVSVDQIQRNQPTELLGAVKATGQVGNLRYGSLLASEDDTRIRGLRDDGTRVPVNASGRDFAVGRLLYEDTVGGGRRGLGWMGTRMNHPDRQATVNGVDFHYFSADTRWVLDGQAMHSDVDGVTGQGVFADLAYRPRQGVVHNFTGTSFDDTLDINDVGFVQRNDHHQLDYRLNVTRSDLDHLRSRTRSLTLINQWNSEGRPVRLGVFGGQRMRLNNNHSLNLNLQYFPPRTDDRLSRGHGTFKVPERWSGRVDWESDPSRPLSLNLNVDYSEEDLGGTNMSYSVGVDWQPTDRFTMGFDTRYRDREGWLVHQGNTRFTTYDAEEWFPELTLDYLFSFRHQFRVRFQWTGIKAEESRFYQIDDPAVVDYLTRIDRPPEASGDFTVSRVNFQARYRWEIAPLSDLFVVYTRGSNLDPQLESDFPELLRDAWTDRIVDNLVVKLRYRFGL